MKALYDQKVIGSNEITFWLNVDGVASSTVTFGGVPDGSSIGKTFSQDLVESEYDWWIVKMQDVNYGGSDIKVSGVKEAMFDTGSSHIIMDSEDYTKFIEKLEVEV